MMSESKDANYGVGGAAGKGLIGGGGIGIGSRCKGAELLTRQDQTNL
jgi:hypothetical protein